MARTKSALKWSRDGYTGVYVAQGKDGRFYSIANEGGGWIVHVRDVAPDLEAYPMKLGRQFSGFTYETLRAAKDCI